MKVTGIIMECNPFHEGHAYLLREARRQTEADYIVVAMSGDYVQRGEPAVFDKYIRAEQILKAGADLVLELPLYAACGSAEYFARGGIALLENLGVVTDLCFGSESGGLDNILRCAKNLVRAESGGSSQDSAAYREKLQAGLRAGMPFPAARAAALEDCFREKNDSVLPFPSAPNDLLAVEYCRALQLCGSTIRPRAIRRIDVPSATRHRKALLEERAGACHSLPGLMPLQTSVEKVPVFPLGPEDFSLQLLYALRMSEEELETYADLSADLCARIRKLLCSYPGFTGFCDLLKTRNLTRTRVSRCLLHILLQIRQERLDELQAEGMALYARPLALRHTAAPLLSCIRSSSSIPFLSKMSEAESLLSQKAFSFLREEIRAEDLYCLTLAQTAERSAFADSFSKAVPRALQRRIPVVKN